MAGLPRAAACPVTLSSRRVRRVQSPVRLGSVCLRVSPGGFPLRRHEAGARCPGHVVSSPAIIQPGAYFYCYCIVAPIRRQTLDGHSLSRIGCLARLASSHAVVHAAELNGLSVATAVILLFGYGAGLLFALRTLAHLYTAEDRPS